MDTSQKLELDASLSLFFKTILTEKEKGVSKPEEVVVQNKQISQKKQETKTYGPGASSASNTCKCCQLKQ